MTRLLLLVLVLAAALATAAAQGTPPPDVQWLSAADLQERLAGKAPWLPLIDRSTLAVGRYRLATGATDGQAPHDRDEIYYVLSGDGQFAAAGETRAVTAGDTIFVAAAAQHRFHDITEDLDLLVFFSSAVPTTGGMMTGPVPTEQTAYTETSARGAARIFYWYGPDSAGQLVVDHGRPRWNPQYEKFLDDPSGRRWRFGENFWTRLDTNIPLLLGGVQIASGWSYCVMQHGTNGLELVLLDPDEVRGQLFDAYEAPKTTGGITVPLHRQRAEFSASRLAIAWTVDREKRDHGELRIHFGPHLLTAELAMQPVRDRAQLLRREANPTDVASVDAIVSALYDVISGSAGQKRDWQRLRSLFHTDARLLPMLDTPGGRRAVPMTVEDYIERSGPLLERDGFVGIELARRTEEFGDFAQVWSSYEGRRSWIDEKPFVRGINSIQLVRENGRWHVLQVVWQQEDQACPIPAKYLPAKTGADK